MEYMVPKPTMAVKTTSIDVGKELIVTNGELEEDARWMDLHGPSSRNFIKGSSSACDVASRAAGSVFGQREYSRTN